MTVFHNKHAPVNSSEWLLIWSLFDPKCTKLEIQNASLLMNNSCKSVFVSLKGNLPNSYMTDSREKIIPLNAKAHRTTCTIYYVFGAF